MSKDFFDKDYASTLKYLVDIADAFSVSPSEELKTQVEDLVQQIKELLQRVHNIEHPEKPKVEEKFIKTAAGPRKI